MPNQVRHDSIGGRALKVVILNLFQNLYLQFRVILKGNSSLDISLSKKHFKNAIQAIILSAD
jgi:hypothetical protein